MICPKCNTMNADGVRFCGNCGAPLMNAQPRMQGGMQGAQGQPQMQGGMPNAQGQPQMQGGMPNAQGQPRMQGGMQYQQPQMQQGYGQQPAHTGGGKRSGKGLLIGLICGIAVLALVAVGAGVVLARRGGGHSGGGGSSIGGSGGTGGTDIGGTGGTDIGGNGGTDIGGNGGTDIGGAGGSGNTSGDGTDVDPAAQALPEPYRPVLQLFRDALDGKEVTVGVPEDAYFAYEYMCCMDELSYAEDMYEEADGGYGYLLMDMDGNGVEELLIGRAETSSLAEEGAEPDSASIIAVFTMSDGEDIVAVPLLFGWPRSSYYLTKYQTLAHYGSNGAMDGYAGVWEVDYASIRQQGDGVRIYYDYESEDDDASFYRLRPGADLYNMDEADRITEEVYNAYLKQLQAELATASFQKIETSYGVAPWAFHGSASAGGLLDTVMESAVGEPTALADGEAEGVWEDPALGGTVTIYEWRGEFLAESHMGKSMEGDIIYNGNYDAPQYTLRTSDGTDYADLFYYYVSHQGEEVPVMRITVHAEGGDFTTTYLKRTDEAGETPAGSGGYGEFIGIYQREPGVSCNIWEQSTGIMVGPTFGTGANPYGGAEYRDGKLYFDIEDYSTGKTYQGEIEKTQDGIRLTVTGTDDPKVSVGSVFEMPALEP